MCVVKSSHACGVCALYHNAKWMLVLVQLKTAPLAILGGFVTIIVASIIPALRGANMDQNGAGPFTKVFQPHPTPWRSLWYLHMLEQHTCSSTRALLTQSKTCPSCL